MEKQKQVVEAFLKTEWMRMLIDDVVIIGLNLKELNQEEDWILAAEDEDVLVQYRKDDNDDLIIRSDIVIDSPLENVLAIYCEP